ncbi:MAG: hypothetical protein R3C18_25720 [Planctomycetaceae bacterium]
MKCGSGDITYLPLCQRGQFAYLALLMDLYSRRVVGWDVRGDADDRPRARRFSGMRNPLTP